MLKWLRRRFNPTRWRRRLVWVLHSPARLAATIGAVLLILGGLAHGGQGGSSSSASQPAPPAASSSPSTRPTTQAPRRPAPKLTNPPLHPAAVHAPPAATRAVTAFMTAWATHRPQQQWWRAVGPLCAGQLHQGLAYTDPERVPATRVTGRPVAQLATPEGVQELVPTDAGRWVVTATRTRGGWAVTGLEQG